MKERKRAYPLHTQYAESRRGAPMADGNTRTLFHSHSTNNNNTLRSSLVHHGNAANSNSDSGPTNPFEREEELVRRMLAAAPQHIDASTGKTSALEFFAPFYDAVRPHPSPFSPPCSPSPVACGCLLYECERGCDDNSD